MGYIAYAAGTLIIAVLVHSVYTRTVKNREEALPTRNGTSVAKRTVPEANHTGDGTQEENKELDTPAITLQVSEHDAADKLDGFLHREDTQKDGAFSQQKNGTTMNGHAKPTTAQSMPPPPPPQISSSLNSAASTGPAKAVMGPPSFLPPRSRSPPRLKPATVSSLAPAPRSAVPGRQSQASSLTTKPNGQMLAPPPSAASSLRVPQQKVLTNTRMQPRSQLDPNALTTSTQAPGKRPSRKVILSPGHSPLDWAALARSTSPTATTKLRGPNASTALGPYRLGRITPSQLKAQTGRRGKDAWTVYQGKVYNITAYLDFHPGGRGELMKGAGRSSDQLFAEVHPWVNWEGMLNGCLVGLLVAEDDPAAMGREAEVAEKGIPENDLDEMD